jgi:hypothetical protein
MPWLTAWLQLTDSAVGVSTHSLIPNIDEVSPS